MDTWHPNAADRPSARELRSQLESLQSHYQEPDVVSTAQELARLASLQRSFAKSNVYEPASIRISANATEQYGFEATSTSVMGDEADDSNGSTSNSADPEIEVDKSVGIVSSFQVSGSDANSMFYQPLTRPQDIEPIESGVKVPLSSIASFTTYASLYANSTAMIQLDPHSEVSADGYLHVD